MLWDNPSVLVNIEAALANSKADRARQEMQAEMQGEGQSQGDASEPLEQGTREQVTPGDT